VRTRAPHIGLTARADLQSPGHRELELSGVSGGRCCELYDFRETDIPTAGMKLALRQKIGIGLLVFSGCVALWAIVFALDGAKLEPTHSTHVDLHRVHLYFHVQEVEVDFQYPNLLAACAIAGALCLLWPVRKQPADQ
jgi:hypothetical protein